MRYLIFNSLAQAEAINTLIGNYMTANIQGYNATQWSEIVKNNDGTKFAISIQETDKRNPQNALNNATKNKLVELDDTWYSDSAEFGKILNFV